MRCSAAARSSTPNGDGAPSGTYHTVCVRTCDGYYFPISYSTLPSHFAEDERTCQRQCPAAEVALYSYRNPGEDMDQAVSNSGQPYTALPIAYRYRTELIAGCSCRRPGQSWADALKNADDSRHARERRHRRDRPERQGPVASRRSHPASRPLQRPRASQLRARLRRASRERRQLRQGQARRARRRTAVPVVVAVVAASPSR